MFAHGLAILLGLSSFIFYMAAFFYPEVHRRIDFWLSGLGMACAVVLWFCAGQITGLVLLSQLALIVLLGALGWQTLSIRREKTPVYQQTPVVLTPEVVGTWAKSKINQLRIAPEANVRPVRPQNPSLNATSAERFKQTPDPRRRPVYDYEFVEDGMLLEMTSGSLVTDPLVEEIDTASDPVSIDVIPPSAEAEVIVAIAPPDPLSDLDLEEQPNASDKDTDPSPLEPSRSESSPLTELAPLEIEFSEPEPSEPELSEPEPSVADEDWGLEIEDSWANVPMDTSLLETSTGSQPSNPQASDLKDSSPKKPGPKDPTQKPSALAVPIILLGWIKDVIFSLAKPKPSKPVIEIPRRNIAEKPAGPIIEPDARPKSEPVDSPPIGAEVAFTEAATPPGESIVTNSTDLADEDNWEESNWDD
ncbi:MAG: Ycf66 family protein [Phormidesmis sp.]